MSTKFTQKLSRLLSSRDRLNEQWRAQHRDLHDDRNKTAGKIYECDNEIRECAKVIASEEYAASWIDRWSV